MVARVARALLPVAFALAQTAAAESTLEASDEVTCWPSAPLRLVLPANPGCAVTLEADGADIEAILAVDLLAPLAALRRALTRGR